MQGESGIDLGGVSIFAGMDPVRRRELERKCAFRRFRPDQQIFDRRSPTTEMLCIVRGAVRIVIFSASGREVRFDDLAAGDYFGELACLDGGPRSASAVALADTVLAAITPALLERVLLEEPAVARTMMRRMARLVRNATDRIVDLSVLGSYNRVCAELLRLASLGTTGGTTSIVRPYPSRIDIAARVSTSEGTVSRVLSDLARTRLVAKERGGLVVRDVPRLKRMVERFSDDPEDHASLL